MADPLDTVQKLMALALNNPNAEEARSAALKAVQMIGAHGFRVERVATTPQPVPMPPANYWQDMQQRMAEQARQQYQQPSQPINFYEMYQQYMDRQR
jgi:hypothetical protein